MRTEEQIKQEIDTLRKELNAINETTLKKELPNLRKKLIGTYWKTENCYSMPKGPEDYWTLHMKIIEVDRDGMVFCAKVQIDVNGDLSIESRVCAGQALDLPLERRYEKSSRAQFSRALKKASNIVSKL